MRRITCQELVTQLAAPVPVPGGGGACAMVGAVGTALGHMVGSFTVGKKKYAAVEEDIKRLNDRAEQLQEELMELMNKDAEAFIPVAKAYKMPAETETEKKKKAEVMEEALHQAALPPLRVMEKAGEALLLLKEYEEKGSTAVISDAGVGAVCCRAAIQGAALNVFINTGSMKNRRKADELNHYAQELEQKYLPIADEIYHKMEKRFGAGL